MPGPDRSQSIAGSSRHTEYKIQPPRPPNAWILYRKDKAPLVREAHGDRISQAEVSKIVSDMWRNETEGVKRHYEREAEAKKAEHQRLYPDYRFCPQRKEDKLRAKEDRKQRRTRRLRVRDATPSDADTDTHANADANVTMPDPPPMHYIPQAFLLPTFHPRMVPYMPEARYGPFGPSPPISAAPSPVPSDSPRSQSYSEESPASTSSSPSTQPSPGSGSQTSSSTSQFSMNQAYLSPLCNSQQPSSIPYGAESLTALLFQPSVGGELPMVSSEVQFQSARNALVPTAVPVLETLHPKSPQDVTGFCVEANQAQDIVQYPQSLQTTPPSGSLDGSTAAPQMSNVGISGVEGHDNVAVGIGAQSSSTHYNQAYDQVYIQEFPADFEYEAWERSFMAGSAASSTAVGPPPVQDIQALFHTPSNPEIQAYTAAQQRQPSAFSQEMMSFFDFEAAGGFAEEVASTVPVVTAPTTVDPHELTLQTTQQAVPVFTQMTNTPTVAQDNLYIPPAGAIYSSMRRVGATWKPFPDAPSPAEEPAQSWDISTTNSF